MKKQILFFLCLALGSLACLQSAVGGQQLAVSDEPSAASYQPTVSVLATVGMDTPAAVRPAGKCAVVTAAESLHLRVDASEKSAAAAWMRNGDLVHVVSTAIADWWLVQYGTAVGYARSAYLQESECE